MLVSIVLPTFNRLGYLEETLRSVLAQTYTDFEILMIDDDSEEDTEGLARSFNDERIKFFREPHCGLPATNINKGLARARGEGVIGLGSDDNMLPDALQKLTERFLANPDCVMVHSDVWLIDGEGKRLGRYIQNLDILPDRPDLKTNRLHTLLYGNSVCGTTALMRKSVVDRIGYFDEDPAIHIATDYDMWIRLAADGYIEYIDEPLGEFRVHSENLSGDWRSVEPRYMMVKKFKKIFTSGEEREILDRHEAELCKLMSRIHVREGDEKKAASQWWAHCVKTGRPWLYPAIYPTIWKWRKRRRLIEEKGMKF